jgi:hypothetical protein
MRRINERKVPSPAKPTLFARTPLFVSAHQGNVARGCYK